MLPKSFLQSCFESPCLGATEGMKPGATDERVCTLLQGCMCSTGSPVFDPWFNSEDTSAEVLETPCSLLPVCCHSGIVWMSSKHMQLQLGHLCSGTAMIWWPGNGCSFTCLLHSLRDCFIWSQLFQLCKFLPIMSLFLLAVDGSAALYRGAAGRSPSSQSASVSSFCLQQKPLLLPTEQHRPKAPSSLWTPERSAS